MAVRDRLLKGTALNLVAVGFNQGSTLVVNVVVARLLMREAFGEYAMVQSTLLTAATLAQLSTGYTAAKHVAESRSTDPARAGRVLGMCAVVSAVMAVLATAAMLAASPWLADAVLGAPRLASALALGSGYLLFSAINGYQLGALAGLEAYGALAKAGVISGGAAIAAISLGAWAGGLDGALIGLSAGALVRCAAHNRWLRAESRAQGITPRYRGSLRAERAAILRFALPAAMAGYYTMPMVWLASSFLVRRPGGYAEMALFAAANNLRIIALFVPNVINNVGLSILNNERAKGDPAHYRRVYRGNVLSIFAVTALGAVALGLLGKPLLSLFGEGFADADRVLWLLLASTVLEGACLGLYQHVQASGRLWLSFALITLPRDTLLVVGAYLSIAAYGAVGLAASYVGAAALSLALHAAIVAALLGRRAAGGGAVRP